MRLHFLAALSDGVVLLAVQDIDIEELERLCRIPAVVADCPYSEQQGASWPRLEEIVDSAMETYESVANSVERSLMDDVPLVKCISGRHRGRVPYVGHAQRHVAGQRRPTHYPGIASVRNVVLHRSLKSE